MVKTGIRRKSVVAAVCLLLLAVQVNAQPPAAGLEDFRVRYGGTKVAVVWNAAVDAPVRIWNMDAILPGLEDRTAIGQADIEGGIRLMLRQDQSLIKINDADLKASRIRQIGRKWFVSFQQQYRGIPVYGVRVGAVVTDRGKITSFSSDYRRNINIGTDPRLNLNNARQRAIQSYESGLRRGLKAKKSRLVVFPKPGANPEQYDYRLAWHFLIQGDRLDPKHDQYFVVDASNGEILLKSPAYVEETIAGKVQVQVFPVLPTDPLTTVPLAASTVRAAGNGSAVTNASGGYAITAPAGTYQIDFTLEGPFAKVRDESNVDFVHTVTGVTCPGTCDYTWAEDPATTIEETDGINVFYHLNLLHTNFYKAVLGYNWVNAWTGTAQMNATVNGNFANAYAGEPIQFGNNVFARSSDVVYHEATHNVLNELFGDWIGYSYGYSTEGAAMDEGFADYFACAFTNDSHEGEGCGITRNLDNTMQYPFPYAGGAHNNGQIIAGAVWDLRTDFGLTANEVDAMAFDALNIMSTLSPQYHFSDPGHGNFLSSLLASDDDNLNMSDGTPHDREIFQAFRNHNLLPVDVLVRDDAADNGNVPSPVPFWTSPDIIIDAPPYQTGSGDPVHENAELGSTNKIHVRVRNNGYLSANQCKVKLYWANPSTGLTYPADWHLIGEADINNLQRVEADPDGEKVVIDWTPVGTGTGHFCLLARLECPQDPITEEGDVRYDNNIAQKNITMVNLLPLRTFNTYFYVNPLPPGALGRRTMVVTFPQGRQDGRTRVTFQISAREMVSITNRPVRRYAWGSGWQLGIVPRDPELVLSGFRCSRRVKVKMKIESPANERFTMRIVEKLGAEVVGGLDFVK